MRTIDSREKNASGQLLGHPMRKEAEAVGVEFMPPTGFEPKGRKGTATVAWSRKPDGKLVLTSINGVSIGGADEEAAMEDEAMAAADEVEAGEEMA